MAENKLADMSTEFAQKAELICENDSKSILHECGSIRRMLIAAINTAKENTK